ncbi:MAG: hypothetical protein P1U34_06415 [Coxiellaceae bacterium]|nr:hypothetical protein [Coxiellaceae bacterium]
MKPSIKTLLIISAIAGGLSSSVAFAAQPAQSQNQTAALGKILADIDGVMHATAQKATAMTNQVDLFLSSIENSDTSGSKLVAPSIDQGTSTPAVNYSQSGLANYVNYNAAQATSKNVKATLQYPVNIVTPQKDDNTKNEFLNALFENNQTSAQKTNLDMTPQQTSEALLSQLTAGTPADDTLYVSPEKLNSITSSTNKVYLPSGQKDTVAKPTKNFTAYLSAPTFTSPYNGSYFGTKENNAYSFNAAKAYLGYLTDAGIPVSVGIPWESLAPGRVNDPTGKDHADSVRAKDIQSLMNNPDFQQYQYTIRNMVAARSMVTDVFNQLLYERAPSVALAKQANLPPQYESHDNYAEVNGKMEPHQTTVSPMQLENYIANHRVNSTKWHQAMSTASPATVQRETLYVLAEMLSKMQQAHLDREKMIELNALEASETMQAMKRSINSQVTKVTAAIAALPGVKVPSKSGNS